jgi:2-phosphosulfolactate phosphatase
MNIHVLLSPLNVDELYFTKKTTVVIDVLRATSVICKALESGAKEIIPVNTVDFAMKISGNADGGQTLLCGERNTKMVEGFNLGNSPNEYVEEKVGGKSIILFTTNGSKAILKAKFSENLFTCSFNNLNRVVEKIVELDVDVEILCAGYNGMFCIEDTVCAGRLIGEIEKLKPGITISDSGKACVVLNNKFGRNIHNMLSECEHGKLLIDNEFSADLEYCSKLNNSTVLPSFSSGVIKALQEKDQKVK